MDADGQRKLLRLELRPANYWELPCLRFLSFSRHWQQTLLCLRTVVYRRREVRCLDSSAREFAYTLRWILTLISPLCF